MSVSLVASGTLTYLAGAGAPAYPAGIQAGDYLLAVWGFKPTSAPTPPAGWRIVGVINNVSGAGQGIDTGDTAVVVLGKVATGTESGTLANPGLTSTNVSWSQIHCLRKTNAAAAWSVESAEWRDTSGGSTTMGPAACVWGYDESGVISNTSSDMPIGKFAAGDFLLVAASSPTDIGAGAAFSAEAVSITGCTMGAATEINEPFTSLGQDLGGVQWYQSVASGASTQNTWASVVATATIGGTTTNQYLCGAIVRLREKVPPGPPTGVTATTTQQDQVTVSWTPPASGTTPDTYTLYRDGSPIITGITGTSAVDTGLGAPYTNHSYTVVSVSASQGSSTASSAATGSSVIGDPAGVNYQRITGGVKLRWTAKSYSGSYIELWSDGVLYWTSAMSATPPQSITGLVNGDPHTFKTRHKIVVSGTTYYSGFSTDTIFLVGAPTYHTPDDAMDSTTNWSGSYDALPATNTPLQRSAVVGSTNKHSVLSQVDRDANPDVGKYFQMTHSYNYTSSWPIIMGLFSDAVPADKVVDTMTISVYFTCTATTNSTFSLAIGHKPGPNSGRDVNDPNDGSISFYGQYYYRATPSESAQWVDIVVNASNRPSTADLRDSRLVAWLNDTGTETSGTTIKWHAVCIKTTLKDGPQPPDFHFTAGPGYIDVTADNWPVGTTYASVVLYGYQDDTSGTVPNTDGSTSAYLSPGNSAPQRLYIKTHQFTHATVRYNAGSNNDQTVLDNRDRSLLPAPLVETLGVPRVEQRTSLTHTVIWSEGVTDGSYSYQIFKDTEITPVATVAGQAAAKTFSYDFPGLTVGQTYKWSIRRVHALGSGATGGQMPRMASRILVAYPNGDIALTGTATVTPASPATRYDKVDDLPVLPSNYTDLTDYIQTTPPANGNTAVDLALNDPASVTYTPHPTEKALIVGGGFLGFGPASYPYPVSMGCIEVWQGTPGTGTRLWRDWLSWDFQTGKFDEGYNDFDYYTDRFATTGITSLAGLTLRLRDMNVLSDNFDGWPDGTKPCNNSNYFMSDGPAVNQEGGSAGLPGITIQGGRLQIAYVPGSYSYNGYLQVLGPGGWEVFYDTQSSIKANLYAIVGASTRARMYLCHNYSSYGVWVDIAPNGISIQYLGSSGQTFQVGSVAATHTPGDLYEARHLNGVVSVYKNGSGTAILTGSAIPSTWWPGYGAALSGDGVNSENPSVTWDNVVYSRAYQTSIKWANVALYVPVVDPADPPPPSYVTSSDSGTGTDVHTNVDKGTFKSSSDSGSGTEGPTLYSQSQIGHYPPDAIVASSGFTGPVSYVQDDPAAPDGFELAGQDAATSVRFSFPDPSFNPYGTQHIRLRVRMA